MKIFSVIAVLVMGAASCGPSIPADQACNDYAKALCARADECRHNATAMTWGTIGNCIQREHDNCMASLAADGTGNSPQALESCAMAYPSLSCQDYLQNNAVKACPIPIGSHQIGQSCQFSGQCQTGFCKLTSGSQCGTCQKVPVIGDSCVESACGPNQLCSAMKTCQAWVQAGGTCDNKTLQCAPHTWCVIPAGAMAGTCQPSAMVAGATCDYKRQTGPGCDFNTGTFCASNNQCVNITYVSAGAACDVTNGGTGEAICSNGSSCYPTGSGGSACLALGKEGAACDTMAGPGCMAPARCVTDGTGTSGTCSALDASLCM